LTLKEFVSYINPRVPKRVLLFIAGFVWVFAAYRVFLVMHEMLQAKDNLYIIYGSGIFVYFFFFQFVFHKVLVKHTRRIINKKQKWVCIFSFFDVKSYLVMACMVILGIVSRKYLDIPHVYLSAFFVTISASLITSSVYFIYYGIRFNYTVEKFSE
jgi:hypothetical protein